MVFDARGPSRVDRAFFDRLIAGGAVLGGGGGGSMADGHRLADLAVRAGTPRLINLSALAAEAVLVTVSAVGAPAARDRYVHPDDFAAAVTALERACGIVVEGLVTSENGGAASVNGFLQSACLGIPVVDAPGNGRAHPTGVMGSMGLDRVDGYVSCQAAVGGNPARGCRLTLFVAAALHDADALVRQAAVHAGGMVAVARNPIAAEYVAEHGAPGALGRAASIGEIVLAVRPSGGWAVARALADALGGRIVAAGPATDVVLETRGGYDLGRATIDGMVVTFWNEYMTAESGGRRAATFPDLITTISLEDGWPVSTADLRAGTAVAVLAVPREGLLLGAGVRDDANLRAIERALGVAIVEAR